VLDDERPQNVLRGVVALSPLGIAFGELSEILVDHQKNLGIVVEDLTDCAVSVTIAAYDLGQPIVIGLKTQHGFLLSTHPRSPSWSLCSNHEDKDASFFINPDRVESTPNPFRNRNELLCCVSILRTPVPFFAPPLTGGARSCFARIQPSSASSVQDNCKVLRWKGDGGDCRQNVLEMEAVFPAITSVPFWPIALCSSPGPGFGMESS
jgi:hypothetical protein